MNQNDDERELEEMPTNKSRFKTGFLIGLLGYGVNVVLYIVMVNLIALIHSIETNSKLEISYSGSNFIGLLLELIIGAIFGAIIWTPLAIIAGLICEKRGKRATKWFVASAIFVILLIAGRTCGGLLL